MELSDLDKQLVELYADKLTHPLRYGENGTFFWFPGAGMTTVLRDLFSSKHILQEYLGKLTNQLKLEKFFGHLADKRTLSSLLNEAGYSTSQELLKSCEERLQEGYEIVYILTRIDDFPQKDRIAILKLFTRLSSLNPRRVHILYNSFDKPWFIKILKKHPELLVLANKIEIMQLPQNEMIAKYIEVRSKEYGYQATSTEVEEIIKTYGGMLQLTKEYLRNRGDTTHLKLKLGINWKDLPKSYQEILKRNITKEKFLIKSDSYLDLKNFGVLDLKVFSLYKTALDINPDEILTKLLTKEEQNLWNYCKTHLNEVIDKETAVKILRPENSQDLSLWAIDKAVSRFRKKLAKAGIDPTLFKTLKKRGYTWQS